MVSSIPWLRVTGAIRKRLIKQELESHRCDSFVIHLCLYYKFRIWLEKFIKNSDSRTKNENYMTQRYCAAIIKPWKWLALTMSYNISESQKRLDIEAHGFYDSCHNFVISGIRRMWYQLLLQVLVIGTVFRISSVVLWWPRSIFAHCHCQYIMFCITGW